MGAIRLVAGLQRKYMMDGDKMQEYLKSKYIKSNTFTLGSRKKKVLLLMAGPLKPTPPPSSIMAVGTLECWKKRFQTSSFFLWLRPLRVKGIWGMKHTFFTHLFNLKKLKHFLNITEYKAFLIKSFLKT